MVNPGSSRVRTACRTTAAAAASLELHRAWEEKAVVIEAAGLIKAWLSSAQLPGL